MHFSFNSRDVSYKIWLYRAIKTFKTFSLMSKIILISAKAIAHKCPWHALLKYTSWCTQKETCVQSLAC